MKASLMIQYYLYKLIIVTNNEDAEQDMFMYTISTLTFVQ